MKKQIISLAICLVFAAIATATGVTNSTQNSGNPGANNAGTLDSDSIDTAEARIVEDTGIPESDVGATSARKGTPKKMSRSPSASGTVQPRSTY